MSNLTPQDAGRAWEVEFAKSVGGKPVLMSGAGFCKLDVRGSSMLWSLKWSAHKTSFTFTDALMREAIAAIRAPGGYGGSLVPGLAFKTAGGEYVVLRKDDAMMLMTSDEHSLATPASNGVIDLSRRVPEYLRKDTP